VARGYWQRAEESRETFSAFLADTGEGPFLRTGDLGFIRQDQLFVTGRLKDLIIIGGRNHYPHDIERTAAEAHPAVRATGCAAFSVQGSAAERLVIAAEIEHGLSARHGANANRARLHIQAAELIEAIRRAVAENHDVRVDQVVLVKTGTLPKTTSGKLQRYACRTQFLDGRLETLNGGEL
jgi:acyl-CoA synthetase (AMP-forming)/AMP-acid ligase II